MIEKKNNGPVLRTRYFTQEEGGRKEVHGDFTQKIHAYKNYVCKAHDRFWEVNLYSPGNK